ncbi:MAG: hypothetical protein KDC44_16580 [Phaeodactylibacter sp.]|nr:hypothetical protein [Phaeodactylibacter sp.]
MKQVLLLFFLSAFVTLSFAQTVTGSFELEGFLRDYRLYLPESYDGNTSFPLVFNLHGYTSDAAQQQLYSQMDAVADEGQFLVCYPNGIDNQWNSGFGGAANDVAFIDALIDTLLLSYNINPDRIYSCGMSNGGYMSYKLACELNDRIAAVASVTGSMTPEEAMACMPGRPVPTLQIHGTLDAVVPYIGSVFSYSMDALIDFWLANNGCADEAVTYEVPNLNVVDGSTALRYTWSDCAPYSEVVFYKVEGGAHTWPGAAIPFAGTNYDFNASAVIWDFFNKYKLEGIVDATTTAKPEAKMISVRPNPFLEEICLQEVSGLVQLRLWDIYGRLMATTRQDGRDCWAVGQLQLPTGCYFLEVESSEFTTIQTLVH